MEFLLIWVLNGHFADSGLRYANAGECYAAAQNAGSELQYASNYQIYLYSHKTGI